MAGTAVRGRLTWQDATVQAVTDETASVRTIELEVPDWAGHQAGQHLDVRLTADDGYVAERSYSIASAPGEPVAITVERLPDGEVSPYLTEELRAGDEIEIRGPIGGYFVWPWHEDDSPLLLLAGGSGVVPFRSILRHRAQIGSSTPARLLLLGQVAAGRDLPQRARCAARRRRGDLHADPAAAAGVDGTRGTRHRCAATRGRLARQPASDCVRVRTDCVRGERRRGTCRPVGYPPDRIKTERYGGVGGT